MDQIKQLEVIACIHNDFKNKFGIPRQSGLIKEFESSIVFEGKYKNDNYIRGLEEFSHIWLIWGFSKSQTSSVSATVRPPRLGGNIRKGVFATRSPFRPNGLGLSSVNILRFEKNQEFGTVIYVGGADLMDGTPIYDIKPYLPYVDIHKDALGGFSDDKKDYKLTVDFPLTLQAKINKSKLEQLKAVLASDPRPAYHNDADRIYGFEFANYNIKFKVEGNKLNVKQVEVQNE